MFATTLLSISTLNLRAGIPVGGLGYHPALEMLQHFKEGETNKKNSKVWSSLCFIHPCHVTLTFEMSQDRHVYYISILMA